MDFLKPEEARQLLAAAHLRWYPFFLTALTTGLRLGELRAMKWAHLEWSSSRYFVRENLARARYEYAGGFTSPKTEGSAQSVDLTPACIAALHDHKQQQAGQKLRMGSAYQDHGLIFTTDIGTALDDRNVRRAFETALKDAGLRHIRVHDLRHTCAALLINQGVSPKYVQRQLRHGSIEIKFDCYGHLFEETHQKAVQKLDEVLMGDSTLRANDSI
jgi:integrase